jgi:hypothetical protein
MTDTPLLGFEKEEITEDLMDLKQKAKAPA